MSEIVIRAARLEDADAVISIDQASFSQPWLPATVHSAIEKAAHGDYIALVAEQDGAICGFVVAWTVREEGEIATIAVREVARGQGIGRRLLEAALNECKRRGATDIFLEVRPGNEIARRLYESCGFRVAGVRPKYYRDGDDAVIMRNEELRIEN